MTPQERILVPLALSVAGEAKLPVVEAHAQALGADVVLLHVLEGRSVAADGSVTPAEASARTYLDTVALRLRAAGIAARPLVRIGAVASAIHAVAREQQATLLVVGADARTGLARMLPGGHVDAIVRGAPCPTLLVQPSTARITAGPAIRQFAEDAARIGPIVPRLLGPRTVEVARIIGTSGDATGIGADFQPRRGWRRDDQRFRRILRALDDGKTLPPVQLYKLGYGYYVVDGHHRVAAARLRQQLWIDAEVTEFYAPSDTATQRLLGERLRFEQVTGLTRVGAGLLGSYVRLEDVILEYADAIDVDDLHEAASRWYTAVFRPAQLRLRTLGLHQYFAGERTADVLLRIADALASPHEPEEPDLSPAPWETALLRLAESCRGAIPLAA